MTSFYTVPEAHIEAVKAYRAEVLEEVEAIIQKSMAKFIEAGGRLPSREGTFQVGYRAGLHTAANLLLYDIKSQEDFDRLRGTLKTLAEAQR